MDALAFGLQHAGDRILGEPVDLQLRVQAAGSRAIATSRCAWPSPIGEEIYRTCRRRPSRRDPVGPDAGRDAKTCSQNSRSARLIGTGLRACGKWPAPWITTSRPRARRASARPSRTGVIRSRSPWITSTGHARLWANSLRLRRPRSHSPRAVAISVVGSVSSAHPNPSSMALLECC
jgi:hypothetical protein